MVRCPDRFSPIRALRGCGLLVMLGACLTMLSCQPSSSPAPTPPAPVQRPPVATPPVTLPPEAPPVAPEPAPAPVVVPGPPVARITQEPLVRVRLMVDADNVQIAGTGSVAVSVEGQENPAAPVLNMTLPVRMTAELPNPGGAQDAAPGFILSDGEGRRARWPATGLRLVPAGESLKLAGQAYPGFFCVHLARDAKGRLNGRLDVVNHVALETYLPGVLAKELFAQWHLQTFKAQAIAARSYALYERHRRRGQHFDLESTTASQVYGGATTLPVARQAAEQTRGRVLVFEDHVLPAFYSSDAGSRGQDAAAAFPVQAAGMAMLTPLRGQDHSAWSPRTRHAQWGPVTRSLAESTRRIAAWGRQQEHPVAGLGALADIRIQQRSSRGRPAVFLLVETSGRTWELAAEPLRFALNHEGPGLPPLATDQNIRSSDVDLTVANGQLILRGRGFGHGVGLSQWTAQIMAGDGMDHTRMLTHFYPGAQLVTLYP